MKLTLGEEETVFAAKDGKKVAVGKGPPALAGEDCYGVVNGDHGNGRGEDEDDGGEDDNGMVEVKEGEVRWAKHYTSAQEILLVGDGDFSFSLSLAVSFASAANIVATSLDSAGEVKRKYQKAKSNIRRLKKMGATLLHGVDATKMKLHKDFKMRKFDRIIFNFPHAGFKGKEDHTRMISLHKKLVCGFFRNASRMLQQDGEIHISHKISFPFSQWKLEELASNNSLVLFKCAAFKIEDYPGYNNKRGDGPRCDKPFPLGECCTFMFRIGKPSRRKPGASNAPNACGTLSSADLPERNPYHVPIASHGCRLLGSEGPPIAGYPNSVLIASHDSLLLGAERPPIAGYSNSAPISTDDYLLLGAEKYPTVGYPNCVPMASNCHFSLGTERWSIEGYVGYVNVSPNVGSFPGQFLHHSKPQLGSVTDMGERMQSPRMVVDSLLSEIFVDYMVDAHVMHGGICPEFRSAVHGLLRESFAVYMNEVPGRTAHGFITHLHGLHRSSVLRAAWLRRMLQQRQQLPWPVLPAPV